MTKTLMSHLLTFSTDVSSILTLSTGVSGHTCVHLFVWSQGTNGSRVSRPVCRSFHVQRRQTQFGQQCCKFLLVVVVKARMLLLLYCKVTSCLEKPGNVGEICRSQELSRKMSSCGKLFIYSFTVGARLIFCSIVLA